MCEFKVFLNGEEVFRDATYAKIDRGKVVLRDILGISKEFQGCVIGEVDAALEKLTLYPCNPSSKDSASILTTDFEMILKRGEEFHGHLGPFLALGVRMGLLAKERLGSDGFSGLSAVIETDTHPPMSCIADGIQVSTGCTLGRGKVKMLGLGKPAATFHTGSRHLRLEVKTFLLRYIERELSNKGLEEMREIVEKISAKPDSDLFDVKEWEEK